MDGALVADGVLPIHFAVYTVDFPSLEIFAVFVYGNDVRPIFGALRAHFDAGGNDFMGDVGGENVAEDVVFADEKAARF